MEVVYSESAKKLVPFEELKLGDTYFDAGGVFCIKIQECGDCLAYIDGVWYREFEYKDALVEPVKATITVERQ